MADGRAAIDFVCSRRVDLVLLDIAMPGIGGIQVLEEIRRHHSALDLPIIMVTAHASSQAIIDAPERGANDYVTKPVDLPTLLARVRTQLRIHELACLKDDFLSIASHDLKNPLNVLRGALHTLAVSFPVRTPMTEQGHWLIETATRRSRRMTRIVTDFFDLAAADQGQLVLRQPRRTRAKSLSGPSRITVPMDVRRELRSSSCRRADSGRNDR